MARPPLHIVGRWSGTNPLYERMARVLEYSATQQHPEAYIRVRRTSAQPTSRSTDAFVRKAADWMTAMRSTPEGHWLALLDVDMIVQAPLWPAFEALDAVGADVGITTRGGLETLNSGALYLRMAHPRRLWGWLRLWAKLTESFCARNSHDDVRYGDQDALRVLIDRRRRDRNASLVFHELPCARWNCTQLCWGDTFDGRPAYDAAAALHVKSEARQLLLEPGERCHNKYAPLVAERWRQWEARAAGGCAPSPAVSAAPTT